MGIPEPSEGGFVGRDRLANNAVERLICGKDVELIAMVVQMVVRGDLVVWTTSPPTLDAQGAAQCLGAKEWS